MTEGVEDQEASSLYQAFFLWLDPISWSLRKGKRISRSGREDSANPMDCRFLQTSRKSMKKGSNGTIPPSPQNERGDLVVLGL